MRRKVFVMSMYISVLRTVLFSLLILLSSHSASLADLIEADLNSGGADSGFSGGWVGSSGVSITTNADLTYANYTITQSGTAGLYDNFHDSPDRMDSRDLATPMSGEIWFSFLVNVPAGGGFAGLSFHSDLEAASTDYSHNLADLRVVMSPTELWVDWNGAAVNAGWTADANIGTFTAGSTHLVLGKMNVVAGTDTLEVWIDPNLNSVSSVADLPSSDYSQSSIDFTDSIVRIGVPGDDNASVTVAVDAIRLSDTATAFDDVTGVSSSPYVALSSNTLMAGLPKGTFIGNLTYPPYSSNINSFTFIGGADDSFFQILATGNSAISELRTNSILSTNTYNISIHADNNSGNTSSGNFEISVGSASAPLINVDAEVALISGNNVIATLVSSNSNFEAITYALSSGRTDLLDIDGENLVVKVGSESSWGGVGAVYSTILTASSVSGSSSVVVNVEVKNRARGTIIRID